MSITRTVVSVAAAALVMSLALPGQTFTSLYSFTPQGGTGYRPIAGVIVGPQGQLYGTTLYGGAYTYGTAYELAPPASPGGAWTETVLHSFGDQNGDVYPWAGLALGSGGALYGVTEAGGSPSLPSTDGTVYQLRPPTGTSTHWPESVLHQFTGTDGQNPVASLIVGPDHALYGTTTSGSGATYGGTVFRLAPPSTAGGEWALTTLWGFSMAARVDGPQGMLAIQGYRIYGTTRVGGTGGTGTVFELAPPTVEGGGWTETTLYSFTGENGDGSSPYAGVVVDANGVLYGTTEAGGLANQNCLPHGFCGIVFSLTPPTVKGGIWTETILHSFTGQDGDGGEPFGGVILGPNGVLYGTTYVGGNYQACGSGCGMVYELVPPSPPNGTWGEVVLHDFSATDGYGPRAGLVRGPDGTLYGTTEFGGASNQGTVFAVVP